MANRPTFEQALQAWQQLDKDILRFPFDPRQYTNVHKANDRAGVRHCPVCGFPAGQPGYVRFDWPVGHAYFGMAFECPRCNARTARKPIGVLTAAFMAVFA